MKWKNTRSTSGKILGVSPQDYNEDKKSVAAARMQNKAVIEWCNSES